MKVKKDIKILFSIVLLLLTLGVILKLYLNYNSVNKELVFCDFESSKIKNTKTIFTTNNILHKIEVSATSSTEKAFSGTNSMLVDGNEFVNLVTIRNVKPEEAYRISILRNGGTARLIVQEDIAEPKLYKTAMFFTDTLKDEWGSLVVQFRTPPNYEGGNLKIYIWNPDKDVSYFDDLKIEQVKYILFSEFSEQSSFNLFIEELELSKLNRIKRNAFKKGILVSDNDSYVNSIAIYQDQMMEAKVRFKGDWLDHLEGDKWSFRVKLEDDSWNGMCTFSIQTPFSRSFVNEWFLHQILLENDILTTKYGFIPVRLNNRSLGIYAYEEHFEKQLVEGNRRREGPIIVFSEDDLWHKRSLVLNSNESFYYQSSHIKPFKESRVVKDEKLYASFLIAQNLLDSYRNGSLKVSEVFDVDKLAQYMAILSSYGGYHGLVWHNIRFYYNPVTCKLETIGYDCYSNYGIHTWGLPEIAGNFKPIIGATYNQSTTFYTDLLTDSSFVEIYKKELLKFSDKNSVAQYISSFENQANQYQSLIAREFLNYKFDKSQFTTHSNKINSQLEQFFSDISSQEYISKIEALNNKIRNTENKNIDKKFITGFVKCYKESETELKVLVYFKDNIEIIGFGNSENVKSNNKYQIKNTKKSINYSQNITTSKEEIENKYVYYKTAKFDTIYSQKIIPWPAPNSYNPRIDIAANATDISEYTNVETKTINFSGNISFNNHIYIPAGYTVVFDAGTNIDITNDAAFISNSTILIYGTKDKPVKIFSSDKTANGFTILQAEDKSIIKFAEFDNLNTLNYNGWALTGAVSFYESDVNITNSTFTNNHCEDMLNTIRCNFLIKDCNIKNTFGDSHDSDFCTGTLDNCVFTNNGNDAIDFSTSEVEILNCTIAGASDKGISVGENTKAVIKNITISDVNIGIASKDLSHAEIDNCEISNANYGFVLLQKKPEFGPATITANNCKLTDIWTESLIEQKSTLILNGKTLEGKKGKLKALFYE